MNNVRNETSIPITIALKHQEVCVKIGQCFCRNGSAKTFIFMPGVTIRNVPDYALECEDFKKWKVKKAFTVWKSIKHKTPPVEATMEAKKTKKSKKK